MSERMKETLLVLGFMNLITLVMVSAVFIAYLRTRYELQDTQRGYAILYRDFKEFREKQTELVNCATDIQDYLHLNHVDSALTISKIQELEDRVKRVEAPL